MFYFILARHTCEILPHNILKRYYNDKSLFRNALYVSDANYNNVLRPEGKDS